MRLLIAYATTFGDAETVAKSLAKRLSMAGHGCEVENVAELPMEDLVAEVRPVIFCVSTWGEGDPPDEAVRFWNQLQRLRRDSLFTLCYAVYALGDRCYEDSCGFGRKLDECLAARGGARMLDLVENDTDFDANLQRFGSDIIYVLQRLSIADLSHFVA